MKSTKPGQPRVVLVEDHTMVRELFAQNLREQELQIAACCSSVAEGLEACRRESPDLAIVDWTLPDGTGAELLRACEGKLPRTRWIVVTANNDLYAVRKATECNVNGFVVKRAGLMEFHRAVSEVLRGQLYFCPQSAQTAVQIQMLDAWLKKTLTERDLFVLIGIATEKNPKQIADELGVSSKTVQNCISALKDKLGITEPAGLVRFALQWGLAPPIPCLGMPPPLHAKLKRPAHGRN